MKVSAALAFAALVTIAGVASSQAQGLPKPVRDYLERRDGCDHWLGEEPYDAERRAQILEAVKSLRCQTLDRDGRNLRSQYKGNEAVLKSLN